MSLNCTNYHSCSAVVVVVLVVLIIVVAVVFVVVSTIPKKHFSSSLSSLKYDPSLDSKKHFCNEDSKSS